MKKELEYTEEQAKKLFIDWNCTIIGIKAILRSDFDKFINHKFPANIDYVGKVWKSETNKFIAYFEQIENGHYVGYGVNFRGNWFIGIACSNDLDELSDLVEATQEEWELTLEEIADKFNVDVEQLKIKS